MSYLNSVFTCIALSDSLLIQNFLYLFPYFRHSSKKTSIFVTHFRPIGVMKLAESVFYFLYGVNNVLSLVLEISKLLCVKRWYNRYSAWIAVYQHIRERCVIYKRLAWVSVVIIIFCKGLLRPRKWIYDTTAFMPFLYPVGLSFPVEWPYHHSPPIGNLKAWMLLLSFNILLFTPYC